MTSPWVQRNLDNAQFVYPRGSQYQGPDLRTSQPPKPEDFGIVCDACGYIAYDEPRDTDTAHDDLCCGSTDERCAFLPNDDMCITHLRNGSNY